MKLVHSIAAAIFLAMGAFTLAGVDKILYWYDFDLSDGMGTEATT
jgi:hypothetical protein